MYAKRIDDADRLTAWQMRRKRRRPVMDRLMGILYGLLALAALLYFLAVAEAIRSVL